MRLAAIMTILALVSLTASSSRAQHVSSPRRQFAASEQGGLPVYPGAAVAPERNGRIRERATVSVENASVSSLAAARYVSIDPPAKILAYYRARMRALGEVTACSGGTNTRVDIKVDDQSLASPPSCVPDDLGVNETELMVGDESDLHMVAVRPRGTGSEFSMVHVRRR